MSELVREALRQYERAQWWAGMNAYGNAKAKELGLKEEDVVPAVRAVRQRRSVRRPAAV